MSISEGARLPDAALVKMGPNGPEAVSVSALTARRKVVIFAVPGAFTPTCHTAHMPGFIAVKDQLAAKGIDEIVCISVNDAHVMRAWGEATGATAAGITLLADGMGEFTDKLGMTFDAAVVGMKGRSKRYAMMVEDGVVKVWHPETTRGCEVSGGPAMVAAL